MKTCDLSKAAPTAWFPCCVVESPGQAVATGCKHAEADKLCPCSNSALAAGTLSRSPSTQPSLLAQKLKLRVVIVELGLPSCTDAGFRCIGTIRPASPRRRQRFCAWKLGNTENCADFARGSPGVPAGGLALRKTIPWCYQLSVCSHCESLQGRKN